MDIKISKKLSANDIGTTGSHQAGIHIPKIADLLSFFPALDPKEHNPRAKITVYEMDSDHKWTFNFIYYNNRLRGGTRNEYRLSAMTKYLRYMVANIGDDIIFYKDNTNKIFVELKRQNESFEYDSDNNAILIRLNREWSIIK